MTPGHVLVRLHFTGTDAPEHRAELVADLRERFPADDLNLRLVNLHWLNVNAHAAVVADVLDWLAGNLPDAVINAYPMDHVAKHHPSVRRFMRATGFTGLPTTNPPR